VVPWPKNRVVHHTKIRFLRGWPAVCSTCGCACDRKHATKDWSAVDCKRCLAARPAPAKERP